MKSIGVIGAGTWGLALARVLASNGNDVTVWSAIPSEIDELVTTHKNHRLPEMVIPDSIIFTKSLKVAYQNLEVFSDNHPEKVIEENLKYLKRYLNWIKLRMCILQSKSNIKKIFYWLKLSKFINNYYSLKSYFSDFYFLILSWGV